jgi:hypothetical protein
MTVETNGLDSQTGTVQRLKVDYSFDAVPALTNRIVAKRVLISKEFGTRELDFYRLIEEKKLQVPFPACLAWELDETAYLILLEDLSETHDVNWEREPSIGQAQSVATALADLHALWWGCEAQSASERGPTADNIREYITDASAGLHFLLADADFLEEKDVDLIREVLEKAERISENITYL